AVRTGGDLPVRDPQPWIAAIHLYPDRAGREGPMVQVAAMRVVQGLGELPDHLQAGFDGQVGGGGSGHEVVEPLPGLPMLEDDGWPWVQLLAVLLRPDDAV